MKCMLYEGQEAYEKLSKEVNVNLQSNEIPIALVSFSFELLLTNKRVMLKQPGGYLGGDKMFSAKLDDIDSLIIIPGYGFFGVTTFKINTCYSVFAKEGSIPDNELLISSSYKPQIDCINKFIVIYNREKEKLNTIKQGVGPYEEIKKLKELLDIKAITQEEFEAKKKELLDRI